MSDLLQMAVLRSIGCAWSRKDSLLFPFECDPVSGLLSQPCEYTALCWWSILPARRKSQGFDSCVGLKECLCASLCGVVTSDLPPPWPERRRGLSLYSLSFLNWGDYFARCLLWLWECCSFFPFPCTWVNRSFVLDLGGVDVPDTDGPCRPRPCDEPTKEGGTEDLS